MTNAARQNEERRSTSQSNMPIQQRESLSDIRIDYGPSELLGKVFLMTDYALRELGVFLSFGSFEELAETNRANRESWLPIVPTFDPSNGLCDSDSGYVLIGRNNSGRIVVTQGTIIFDWTNSNFKEEAESMRLFYTDPQKRARQQERCNVSAPSAASLRGRVAHHGAAWWHPSVRGNLIGSLIARISRAYSYTRWRPDLCLAINSNALIDRGFPVRNGYQHIERGVHIRNFELGDYDGGVVWITVEELLAELPIFLNHLEARFKQRYVA
jgi:hypothetical protein